MRRRTREAMSMAEDEMLALRFLLRRADRTARPAELAHYLGITTADTNALADKLQRDGRVERVAGFAVDRSASIRATESADAEVRDTLNGMHLRMYAAAMKLTPKPTPARHRLSRRNDRCDRLRRRSVDIYPREQPKNTPKTSAARRF